MKTQLNTKYERKLRNILIELEEDKSNVKNIYNDHKNLVEPST